MLSLNAYVFNRGYNCLFCSKLDFSHRSNRRNTDKCEGIVGVSFEIESVFILLNSVSVGKHVALKVQLQAMLGGFESLCPQ